MTELWLTQLHALSCREYQYTLSNRQYTHLSGISDSSPSLTAFCKTQFAICPGVGVDVVPFETFKAFVIGVGIN